MFSPAGRKLLFDYYAPVSQETQHQDIGAENPSFEGAARARGAGTRA
jgi:hypothetical protein